ncbi:MAG: hypothetical protein ABIY50_00265 [Ignavibacteria bacterium]
MEKRIFGIVLLILGIAGLVLAATNFMYDGTGQKNIKEILIYGILGAMFFFVGAGMIRSTKDKPT